MSPKSLKNLIFSRIKADIKRPLLIESSPGLGKTQIVAQVARELGLGFIALHAPLLQPEDYGFPVVDKANSDVNFVVSKSKFPVVSSPCGDSGILLIDELSQADQNAQKILANLLQEREIHGQKLKPGWTIVATGNRTQDRAGANRLLSHLRNRLTTVQLDASLDDWTQWALANDIRTEVIAFLRFRPGLLTNFDADQTINATPRAWAEGVSASLGVIPSDLELESFSGDVGEGPASEFLGFLRVFRKLPHPDSILLDPSGAPVPTEPATLYALCGALSNKATKSNFDSLMTYVSRLPSEFQVIFTRDSLRKSPDVAETKSFIQWASGQGAQVLT